MMLLKPTNVFNLFYFYFLFLRFTDKYTKTGVIYSSFVQLLNIFVNFTKIFIKYWSIIHVYIIFIQFFNFFHNLVKITSFTKVNHYITCQLCLSEAVMAMIVWQLDLNTIHPPSVFDFHIYHLLPACEPLYHMSTMFKYSNISINGFLLCQLDLTLQFTLQIHSGLTLPIPGVFTVYILIQY